MKLSCSFVLILLITSLSAPLLAKTASKRDIMGIRDLTRSEMLLRTQPSNLKNRIQLAEHYLAINKPKRSIKLLEQVQGTLNRKGNLVLAKAYNTTENHLDELRVYDYLLGMRENDFIVHKKKADLLYFLDRKDEAVLSYKAGAQANSNFRPLWDAWLNALLEMDGREYEARIVLDDMIKKFGPQEEFISKLCYLFYKDGFIQQAEKFCQLGISRNKKDPSNHVYLGLAYKNSGQEDKAEKVLKKVGKRFPASELAQWATAKWEHDNNNLLGAEFALKKALKADPKSIRSHEMLAMVLFKQEKYEEALDHFQAHCWLVKMVSEEFRISTGKLISINPSLHRRYLNIASSCSRMRN